jgi:signal transduction histidine kinase
VDVTLSELRGEYGVEVKDTGRGMPPEFLPYVFQPFRQVDGSSTRSHGGLGLGLAIARHLTELSGGSIVVASPGLDRGTTFTIRLPRHAARRGRQFMRSVAP